MKGKPQDYRRFIGSHVRRLREFWAISQQDLADSIQTTTRYVQHIESGTVNVTVETLVRLAKRLSVEPAELLFPCEITKPKPGRPTAKFAPKPWTGPPNPTPWWTDPYFGPEFLTRLPPETQAQLPPALKMLLPKLAGPTKSPPKPKGPPKTKKK